MWDAAISVKFTSDLLKVVRERRNLELATSQL
jgi:hypothetical protein